MAESWEYGIDSSWKKLRKFLQQGLKFQCRRRHFVRSRERFFDTPDARIAQAGGLLYLRQEKKKASLILESAGDCGVLERATRIEQTLSMEQSGAFSWPFPGEIRQTLTAIGMEVAAEPMVEVEREDGCLEAVSPSGRRVQVYFSQYAPAPGKGYSLEVSFVPLDLSPASMKRLLRKWAAEVELHPLKGRSSRLQLLEQAGAVPPRQKIAFPRLSGDMSVKTAGILILTAHLGQFRAAEDRTLLGLDAAGIHDMRVAARRLRCVLRIFCDALGEKALELERALRELRRELGEVRDQDVFLISTWAQAEMLSPREQKRLSPLRKRILRERDGAMLRVRHRLRSPEYQELCRVLEEIAATDMASVAMSGDRRLLREYAPEIMRRRLQVLLRRGKMAEENFSVKCLHRLRLAAKTMRYAGEWLKPLFNEDFASYIQEIRELQRLLGTHHDSALAARRLQREAVLSVRRKSDHPLVPFLLGFLAARRDAVRLESEDVLLGRWHRVSGTGAARFEQILSL